MITDKFDASKLDSDLYRDVIGHFASGVTIITTKHENEKFGITASAVTSLSLDPPMLIVCVNQQTGTCHAISKAKKFGVNILHDGQGEMAFKFSRPKTDKFKGTNYTFGKLNVPILNDALAHLECKVIKEVTGGTHSVFLAEVIYAGTKDKAPLTYYRGKFGYFQPYDNEKAYRTIRKKVLERDISAGESINVENLQEELSVPKQVIYYALAKLEAEQLLSQMEGGNYTVTPLNIELLNEALETRMVLEVAAIEKTVGNLSEDELKELRHRVESTIFKENESINPDQYIEANTALHDYTMALSRNATLLDSYRRLTAEAVMSSALRVALEANNPTAYSELNRLSEDHVLLLGAYESGNKERAKQIIIQHAEEAKKLGKYLIGSAGGSI